MMLVEIVAAVKMLNQMTMEYKSISAADYDNLKDDIMVKGTIDRSDVILSFPDTTANQEPVLVLVVLSEKKHIMAFSAVSKSSSDIYHEAQKMVNGEISSITYQGKVRRMNDFTMQSIETNMSLNNTYYPYKLSSQSFIGQIINVGEIDKNYTWSAFIASVAGAVVMLAVILFVMKKSINNMIYGILVQRGKIEPELKIRKEDLVLENVDTYRGSDNDSDSFYVNTDYNIHRDDGASSSEEYHFTKSEEQAAEEPLPDEAVPPAAPMRPNDDVSFYSGGLNEEGNFYVEGSEGDDSENPENKRWRY